MEKQLNGPIILITRTNAGIGKATAIAAAKAGTTVILSDYIENPDTEATIRQLQGNATFIQCSVSDEKQVMKLTEQCYQRFGRLDGAFTNAGIPGISAPVASCTNENWDQTINISL